MNTENGIPLSDDGNIVFRLDRHDKKLFEIAKLKKDGESYAYNAIRFRMESLRELYNLLDLGLKTPKSTLPILKTKINGTTVKILNHFGEFDAGYRVYQFTYTDWAGSEKYDFHPWYNNCTECDKGIRLTEEECSKLVMILKMWFYFNDK